LTGFACLAQRFHRVTGEVGVGLFQTFLVRANRWHSVRSYEALVARKRRMHKGDHDMAMMASIGALSREEFISQGDGHVAVLVHNGLRDGMSVYDLGCGSGRTAMALQRSGWQGSYKGADIVGSLVDYLKSKCPGYAAVVHRDLSIEAPDSSVDMIFHWSVFTHLYPEECYLYMEDSFRALKPGGKLVFSFLEMEDEQHHTIFRRRLQQFRRKGWSATLDSLLHRDWIRFWARDIGFEHVTFTDGTDSSHHPAFWQALVAMSKPG
jgi:SAM-dependent methyltransferase